MIYSFKDFMKILYLSRVNGEIEDFFYVLILKEIKYE